MKKKLVTLVSCATLATGLVPAAVLVGATEAAVAAPQHPYTSMRPGDSGVEVKALQHLLLARVGRIEPGGHYGPITTGLVKQFQKSERITVDGIAGTDTLNRLTPSLAYGAEGEAVKALQLLLNKHGEQLEVDGKAGPKTWAAVKTFKAKKKLVARNVTETTWGLLFATKTDEPPVDPERTKVVDYALRIVNGEKLPAVTLKDGSRVAGWAGGEVPYTWGGGHRLGAGPTRGFCDTWPSSSPCLAEERVGVDCSGLTRWAYALAYREDVIGGLSSTYQAKRGKVTTNPQPGDVVFFGRDGVEGKQLHTGIYVGGGKIAHTWSQNADPAVTTVAEATGSYNSVHYRTFR